MKNRNWLLLLVAITSILLYASCTKDSAIAYLGNWKGSNGVPPPFKGQVRTMAVAFVIGTEGYVGTGTNEQYDLNDFWEFHSAANEGQGYWSQIASLPAAGRFEGVGFAIDSLGYVGTGIDRYGNYYSDFWSYSPSTDTWTQKASVPVNPNTTGRAGAIGFGIDHYGYLGCGYDNTYEGDFYKYDPVNDSWSAENGFNGLARRDGGVFIIGTKAYICTGYNTTYTANSSNFPDDMIIFNPANDSWLVDTAKLDNHNTSKSYDDDYGDICRTQAAVFSMNGKGYVSLGIPVSSAWGGGRTTWEYNPVTDLWTRKAPFEGTSRVSPVSMSINNRVFIGTGGSNGVYYQDFWEFLPQEVYVQND